MVWPLMVYISMGAGDANFVKNGIVVEFKKIRENLFRYVKLYILPS